MTMTGSMNPIQSKTHHPSGAPGTAGAISALFADATDSASGSFADRLAGLSTTLDRFRPQPTGASTAMADPAAAARAGDEQPETLAAWITDWLQRPAGSAQDGTAATLSPRSELDPAPASQLADVSDLPDAGDDLPPSGSPSRPTLDTRYGAPSGTPFGNSIVATPSHKPRDAAALPAASKPGEDPIAAKEIEPATPALLADRDAGTAAVSAAVDLPDFSANTPYDTPRAEPSPLIPAIAVPAPEVRAPNDPSDLRAKGADSGFASQPVERPGLMAARQNSTRPDAAHSAVNAVDQRAAQVRLPVTLTEFAPKTFGPGTQTSKLDLPLAADVVTVYRSEQAISPPDADEPRVVDAAQSSEDRSAAAAAPAILPIDTGAWVGLPAPSNKIAAGSADNAWAPTHHWLRDIPADATSTGRQPLDGAIAKPIDQAPAKPARALRSSSEDTVAAGMPAAAAVSVSVATAAANQLQPADKPQQIGPRSNTATAVGDAIGAIRSAYVRTDVPGGSATDRVADGVRESVHMNESPARPLQSTRGLADQTAVTRADPSTISATSPTSAAASFATLLDQAVGATPSPLQAPASPQTSAAAPVTIQFATSPLAADFREAVGVQVSMLANNGIQEAQLHLNPAEMGPISIRIALDGSQAQVDFAVDSAATRSILESGLPELASALRESGLTLTGGGVTENPPGQSGASANQPRGDGSSQQRGDGPATQQQRGDGQPTSRGRGFDADGNPLREPVPARRFQAGTGGVDLYA